MSRAMNVDATRAEVLAMSGKHSASISVIEELVSGGTRVVFLNGDDAALVRRSFGKRVLTGPVSRTPLRGR